MNSELFAKGYPDIGWDPVEGERFLDFLKFCVWVNGDSVEENANLIVRLLIRRPECLGPALRGEGGGGGLLRGHILRCAVQYGNGCVGADVVTIVSGGRPRPQGPGPPRTHRPAPGPVRSRRQGLLPSQAACGPEFPGRLGVPTRRRFNGQWENWPGRPDRQTNLE